MNVQVILTLPVKQIFSLLFGRNSQCEFIGYIPRGVPRKRCCKLEFRQIYFLLCQFPPALVLPRTNSYTLLTHTHTHTHTHTNTYTSINKAL